MKSPEGLARLAVLGLVLALGGSPALAQNFYSLQLTNSPPLPFLPFDVPVYSLGDRAYGYDDRAVDYQSLWAEAELLNALEQELGLGGPVYSMSGNPGACGDLTIPMVTVGSEVVVTVTLTNLDSGVPADVFMADALVGNAASDAHWRWVARGTNGQSFTFTNGICAQAYYVMGCTNDTDGDGLTDAYEILVTKTSPTNSYSVNALFTDAQMENILVNDPRQDCGTDQNTQDETTLLAFSNTVVVAWVDSNLGVPGYGQPGPVEWADLDCPCYVACPVQTNAPQFIGWAVSRDGGVTFTDKGGLPLFSNVVAYVVTNNDLMNGWTGHLAETDLGNAGDPVLARDEVSGTIYLVGNPQRPAVYYPQGATNPPAMWLPLWISTNNAESFLPPINPFPWLTPVSTNNFLDKPALVVDNFPGTGQGNLYMAVTWQKPSPFSLFVARSTDGINWTNSAEFETTGIAMATPTLAVSSNHTVYLAWTARGGGMSRFFFSKSTNFGETFTHSTVILTNYNPAGSLQLPRFSGTDATDAFRAPIIPNLLANPTETNHLYIVYHDNSTNATDQSDIFFIQSTDCGTNWSAPMRVNSDSTTNHQWQPVIAVKPDGTQIFIAWYDRREDATNNSLIRIYGVFAQLPITNFASFTSNFPISTVLFASVFTGTNQIPGSFDPAYPPDVSSSDPSYCASAFGVYRNHMADYDTVVADNDFVYYTWSDKRTVRPGIAGTRNQADTRFIKLAWPPQ